MTQPTDHSAHIRDGHSLNVQLGTNDIWLDVNCPHDGTDWTTAPLMERPPCRRVVDPWGNPDDDYANTCALSSMTDSVIGAAELLSLTDPDRTFTATTLPIEIEWWRDEEWNTFLAPIEQPPGEAEYRQQVAAVVERRRAAASGSAA
jgi:hypothetical protein